MKENNLILSADDFGISQKANNNILKLIELKKLGRVSIMTEGLINPEEINKLLASNVNLDVHLNLKKIDLNTTRETKDGVFSRSLRFLFLYLNGTLGAASAEVSWEGQIKKFETLFGKKPDGLNSHQHIHFFPAYLKVLLRLCKKHKIDYLRFGKCCLRKNTNLICFILNTLRLKNLKTFSQSEIATSDLLISLDWIKNIEKFSNNLPEKTTELVCHPERDTEFEIIKKYF